MLCSVLLFALASQAFARFASDDESFAMNFLSHYQYLSPTRAGNQDLETAIKKFQEFTGLPVTGKLDELTVAQMKAPRCGMPDVIERGRVKRYSTSTKWSRKHLTYHVEHGADLSRSTQDKVFAKALKFWSDVSGLSFSKARSARTADLKISFGDRTHGGMSENTCAYPFDGVSGTLAHAFFPSDGRAHFDEDETFTDGTSRGTNLLWVAVHEFGHSLGIQHSSVRDAVMYPYYTGYVANMQLKQDDISAIQSLYGRNTGGSSGGNNGGSSGGSASCFDATTQCRQWRQHCSYHNFVRTYCKKTCRLC